MRFGLDLQDDESDAGPSDLTSPKVTRFAHPLTQARRQSPTRQELRRVRRECKPDRTDAGLWNSPRSDGGLLPTISRVSASPAPTSTVRTVVPPWLQSEAQKSRRASKLIDESSSDDEPDCDITDSEGSSSGSSGSEHDLGRRRAELREAESGTKRGWRQRSTRIALSAKEERKKEHEKILLRIRMATGDEPESWAGARTRAFSLAALPQTVRMRSVSVQRNIASDPAGPDRGATTWLNRAAEKRAATKSNDVDAVLHMLDDMRLRSEEEERRIDAAFAKRNETLWKNIDAAIAREEAEAADRAAEQERKAAHARAQAEAAEARRKEEEKAAKARAEAERKEAARLEAEEQERLAQAERSQTGGGDLLRVQAKREWEYWRTVMADVKTKVLPAVAADATLRKQCFAAKRQITPKIGQLTNSRSEIERITGAIGVVLTGAYEASPEHGYPWILNHLSKCLIRQAEQEVAAKQSTAFPLARVAQWLILAGHERFAEVLMARLVKKCCWVVAYCPPRSAAPDDNTYLKMIGRGSKDETTLQYTSRMCGISAFFFALLQTLPSPPPQSVPPLNRQAGQTSQANVSRIPLTLRPSYLWTWQSRAITPPMTLHALVPSLFATMLEVAGPAVQGMYGKQAAKLWRLVLDEGIRAKKAEFASNADNAAATTRLMIVLEGWEKNGNIETPTEGREMER